MENKLKAGMTVVYFFLFIWLILVGIGLVGVAIEHYL